MATPRQKSTGKWELALSHKSFPKGRKHFYFDSEEQAKAYHEQWRAMVMAGIEPPKELIKHGSRRDTILAHLIRAWMNSGLAAPTQQSALGSILQEVGSVKIKDADYAWLSGYIQSLKAGEKNLAPSSIRHRVQAIGRCIDEWCRNHPEDSIPNPVKQLPKGYSTYSEVDIKLAKAVGNEPKRDIQRDRRLHDGEQEKIVQVLSGWVRPDRERGLALQGGNALLTLFLLIAYTGLRLREAYLLRRGQVDMNSKVIRAQCSKQWRGRVAFRDVPMRQEVHQAFIEYLSTRELKPDDYFFPFMNEEPGLSLTRVSSRLSLRFTTAFKYVGIEGLTEHDLRHEATCRWLEMKDKSGNWMFRLEEVNRIMGWSPGSVMAHRYASFRGADLAQRIWATDI